MRKAGKNITKARKAVETRPYTLQEAVPLLQKVKYAKFDETVEVTLRLGVDPKHADQMVRGTVVLPHGLGKSKKVLVIATGEKVKEAEGAGADFVGGEEMVEKIQKENWTDFDALIATHGVVMDATARALWVSEGPHLAGRFLRFDLARLLDPAFEPGAGEGEPSAIPEDAIFKDGTYDAWVRAGSKHGGEQ